MRATAGLNMASIKRAITGKALKRLVAILALVLVGLSFPLSLTIKALIPSGKLWYWVTNRGIVIADYIPHELSSTWNVKEIAEGVYKVVNGADACKVEAVALTNVPKPVVYKNATIFVRCNERYLYSDLTKMVKKGRGLVVIYPLPGDTCKRIGFKAVVNNSTLYINITVTKIKKWLDICPPSKLVDVIVAWGNATRVKVYVNGKLTLAS